MDSIYKNPTDEQDICQALRALAGEWGTENVTVHMPAAWAKKETPANALGRVKSKFCTVDTIEIYAGIGLREVSYKLQLAAVE